MSVVCRCMYIGVVVVVVVLLYIKRVRRARARVYTTTSMVVKPCSHKKGQKKTLEHSPTLATAYKELGNQMISDTP